MRPAGYFEAEALAAGFDPTMARAMGQFVARVMDQQAIDERLNYQWITDNLGGSGGTRSVELVIAASNSTEAGKATADYVCEGSGDEVVIQEAIDWLNDNTDDNGLVKLLAGEYIIDNTITMHQRLWLQGSGYGNTFLYGAATKLIDCLSSFAFGISHLNLDAATSLDADNSSGVFHDLYCSGAILLGGALLSNFYADTIVFESTAHVSHGDVGSKVTFDPASLSSVMENVNVGFSTGEGLLLDGSDNRVQNCLFTSAVTLANDNTQEAVLIDGARNSFTNNLVRSWSTILGGRPEYGVEVGAGATDARVKFNDLRSGANGTWGTLAYVDFGAGTLASDNDT